LPANVLISASQYKNRPLKGRKNSLIVSLYCSTQNQMKREQLS
jgi:hypothetical protein